MAIRILKFILLFIIIVNSSYALLIKDIFVDCSNVLNCDEIRNRFDLSEVSFNNREELERLLKEISRSVNYYKTFYNIAMTPDGAVVSLNFTPKPVINEIKVNVDGEFDFSSFPFPQKGQVFSPELQNLVAGDLRTFLESRGYSRPEIGIRIKSKEQKVNITIDVKLGNLNLIKRPILVSEENKNTKRILTQLSAFKDKPWDRTSFESTLEEIKKSFQNEGFYLFDLSIIEVKQREDNYVEPFVKVSFGRRFGFQIRGNESISRDDLNKNIRNVIVQLQGGIEQSQIEKLIKEQYQDLGIFGTTVKTRRINFSNDGFLNSNFYIEINEGKKIQIGKLSFLGGNYFSYDQIKNLYLTKGPVISERSYYDESYTDDFKNILRNEYLKNGFVFIKIIGPEVLFNEAKTKVNIEYRIIEGKQVFWEDFLFEGVPEELYPVALKGISNKLESPLNLIDLKADISQIESNMREEGYYFAKIFNKSSRYVVNYDDDFGSAQLNLKINLGNKIIINSVKIVGLEKTKREVIQRELDILKVKAGRVVTPSLVKSVRSSLQSLGLFQSVNVTPLFIDSEEEQVTFFINLKEKDFGFFEIAPGFRSDIGFKISTAIGNSNVRGLNHSATVKAQVNERLDFSSFDPERRNQIERRMEYDLSLIYDWPFLFKIPLLKKPMNFSTNLSDSRRRFRSFDADIRRLSGDFNFNIWQSDTSNYKISGGLTPELERIRQYDATDPTDQGEFTIVSFTPNLTLDFRDKDINPRKGAIFKLSMEMTRPEFGSKEGELDINYDKIISRNAFYYPVNPRITLAVSAAFGMQENHVLARNPEESINPIPDIKVFRLTGIDRVRGFIDTEINRLNREDLGFIDVDDFDVINKVFFTNIKIEPRFQYSDSVIISPFFDAGRISVDHYKPFDLRKSVGISFKYLTPVGTLNFDYGIKLDRKIFQQGGVDEQEVSGRFHLNLGFF